MTLLLVEDDRLLAETLVDALGIGGQDVHHLDNGDTAYTLLKRQHDYELILLDLNLPGRGGLDVLEALRAHDTVTPVLILTARGAVEDRVRGLDLGADDYLAKPFSLEELEARVRALLRRRAPSGLMTVGELGFDSLAQRFTLGDEALALPPREQRLLGCLMRHAGQPVDKATLVHEAFGDEELGDNAVEVYVHRLRKRLHGHQVTLRTVRGLGYLLEAS
ncbi:MULTISPECIES: response regulator transcription factor [Halomonas]|uniref:response regulator transcription factor n=1 Tax=Halomonas TaxID=2745 RepID=UPI001C95E447|nr:MULTISPECIES: response regulator transcription factor [Halomonas]MED5296023.1 response regulator transcription factor [Pseudomonadota bacterium]MBY5926972.1 response regulator transcription factor [Halomonas sp. DP4Y7-2]MBY5931031.1 response regulator transcription factor [Halomonas sp. DP8Y7-3]MBY5968934.1 response regulator transcription factor [Halomonas denitrificans]MBY5984552.1 response regulator transcription factor [Halomonas sp. DP5Y7-2]